MERGNLRSSPFKIWLARFWQGSKDLLRAVLLQWGIWWTENRTSFLSDVFCFRLSPTKKNFFFSVRVQESDRNQPSYRVSSLFFSRIFLCAVSVCLEKNPTETGGFFRWGPGKWTEPFFVFVAQPWPTRSWLTRPPTYLRGMVDYNCCTYDTQPSSFVDEWPYNLWYKGVTPCYFLVCVVSMSPSIPVACGLWVPKTERVNSQ